MNWKSLFMTYPCDLLMHRFVPSNFAIYLVAALALAATACTESSDQTPQTTVPVVIEPIQDAPGDDLSTSETKVDWVAGICPLGPAKKHQTLVAHDSCGKFELGPSGLIYLRQQQIWVAVSDNFNELKPLNEAGYAIFGFDPRQVRADNTIPVYPLISDRYSKDYELYDLEGITQDGAGNLYAISSLSLHASKPSRDIWYRGQGYRFSLIESKDNPLGVKVDGLSHWSANSRRDLREWVMSTAGFGWTLAQLQNRSESSAGDGGINIEALSISDGNPMLGFRGPLHWDPSSWQATAAEIILNGPEAPPVLKRLTRLNGKAGNQTDTTKQFGFRGLAAIPGHSMWYVAIVGSTISCDPNAGIGCDQLEVLIWNKQSGKIPVRIMVPDRFVAEGIDVSETSRNSTTGVVTVTVGLVDDLSDGFMPLSLDFHP